MSYWSILPSLIQEVREHLQKMLETDTIRNSKSLFSSNVMTVCKKDGTICICIDYRKMNRKTVNNVNAIHRIDYTLYLPAGAKYFSTLDLKVDTCKWR